MRDQFNGKTEPCQGLVVSSILTFRSKLRLQFSGKTGDFQSPVLSSILSSRSNQCCSQCSGRTLVCETSREGSIPRFNPILCNSLCTKIQCFVYNTIQCGCGEIGKHSRLKICRFGLAVRFRPPAPNMPLWTNWQSQLSQKECYFSVQIRAGVPKPTGCGLMDKATLF